MAGKQARGWNPSSHEALLLAFIDEIKPNKAMIQKVTERMTQMGWTYSYDAVNQHVQKLKKNRDETSPSDAVPSPAKSGKGSTPATPSGRKRTASKKTAKSSVVVERDDDELDLKAEDEYEVEFSPAAKKLKN
ncbi:hypothetical protein S40285_03053 [Stachybotrys chlorohalonatus IBT 40285]|uniref:Uncharacterized protein n=1 Tax=Stachybotrys chlorohalonatus (strain IBT 40285) TaxID=1283841 RepID=A0A084QRR6_STAC4|nr:hypothetical protein S40285_03053 [Stachybotrys chlorohalonata IBT 40285]